MIEVKEISTLRCVTEDIITAAYNSGIPGEQTMYVVPESSKAAVERLVVELASGSSVKVNDGLDFTVNSSYVDGDVVSFIRLAQRFLNMCGIVDDKGMDKTTLRTAIYRILSEHKGEFRTIGKFVGRFEYIDQLIDFLGDFSRYEIGEELISRAYEVAENSEDAAGMDQVYLDKIYDFKLLSMYIDDLNSKFGLSLMVNPMARAHELMSKLIENPALLSRRRYREFAALIKSRFIIVGFGAVRLLTPQELTFIKDMSDLGARIEFYPLTSSGDRTGIDDAVYVNGNKFVDNLASLDSGIAISSFVHNPSSVNAGDATLNFAAESYAHRIDIDEVDITKTSAIRCVSIAGLDDRIGYIANEIMDLTRNQGYRYKDMSIVCVDESIIPRLKNILGMWGMDAFVDKKIIISNTPVFRYLMLLSQLPISNYSIDYVLSILRSGLAGVLKEDVDLLENYCVSYNIINGNRLFDQSFFVHGSKYYLKVYRNGTEIPAAEYLWEHVISRVLIPIRDQAEQINAATSLSMKAQVTAKVIEGLKDNIKALSKELVDRGDTDRASALVRGYKEVMELLVGFTLPMNDYEITQKDYCALIMIDMRNKVQGTIPLMVDSVDIITPDQAYFSKTKIMFVIGATAENFPCKKVTEGLMTRVELERFSNSVGVYIPDKVKTRNRSDFVTSALMFNSVSDRLYLINEYGCDSSSVYDYFLKFAAKEEINCFKLPLYGNKVEGRHDYKTTTIDPEVISGLIGDNKRVSVTSIEKYNTCHMQYMIQDILGINERDDGRRVRVNVMGSIIHHMYEIVLKNMRDTGKTLADYESLANSLDGNPDELEKLSVDAFNDYCSKSLNPNEKTPEFFVYPGQKARRIFKYSFPFILREVVSSGYLPVDFERKIQEVATPLEFTSSLGNKFSFVGSADRVDHNSETGKDRVVDYKSGDKDFEYQKALAGVQIQLFAYANALACERDIDDVGYFPIGLKPEKNKKLDIKPTFAELDSEQFGTILEYVKTVIQDSCNGISEGKADALVNSQSKHGMSWGCVYCPNSGSCGNNKSNPTLRVEGKMEALTPEEEASIKEATGKKATTLDKVIKTMKKQMEEN